jgi:hypothetical protein
MSNLSFTLSATVAAVEFERMADDLPQASLEFLLRYGFRQYLQDAVAMSKEEQDEIRETAEEAGENPELALADAKALRVQTASTKSMPEPAPSVP